MTHVLVLGQDIAFLYLVVVLLGGVLGCVLGGVTFFLVERLE
jgi:hypothetical protein